MQKKIWPAIRNYIFLAIGIALIYLVFKDVDFVWMWNEIKGARFSWIFLSMFCGILAMASRAWRWRIMLEPLGFKPSFLHCFYGVSIGYFANIALPRMGEVVRCTILNQTDNVPVNQSFGTVILERVIDVLMLLGLIMLVLFTRMDLFGDFFMKELFQKKAGQGSIFENQQFQIGLGIFVLLGIILVALFIKYKNQLLKISLFQKVVNFLKGIGDGLFTFFKMKKKGWFVFHTLFIWVNYFIMTWICVYSYDPTSMLKAFDGLFLMVVGGLGMTAPVQGGFGAFHYLVEKALMIYQISPSINPITGSEIRPGLVFATIVHSAQFVMTVLLGTFSLIGFTLLRKKSKQNHAA
jgi:uncharacterized membrane protein YbhN (UPF0104 family)